MMANEWDQRPDENDVNHAAFLIYIGLGPERTINSAIAIRRKMTVHKGVKQAKVINPDNRSGHWSRIAANYQWVKRAGAYDLSLIRAALQSSGAVVVAGIQEFASYYLREVRSAKFHAKSFADLISGVQTLSQLFPPETIAAFISAANDGRTDAGSDGKGGVQEIPKPLPR